jgi:putative nucleotidyltransferase with HDIG domain
MTAKLEDIFPQIKEIKNKSLREGVETCWREAVRRGGWQLDDLEKVPFTLTFKECEISLAAHTRAVTDCCLAIGRVLDAAYRSRYRINFDVLTAGALLHDVGKLLEYKRDGDRYVVSAAGRILRHPISGCALAAEAGLPESVQHIIAVHSHEGDKGHRTPEAYIVHHSDFVNFHPLADR